MPSRIPVRVAEHDFRSINQARGHYCEILHRYQPGQRVNEQDQAQVLELMDCAGVLPDAGSASQDVWVTTGQFGRTCFVGRSEGKGSQVMSIIRAVKNCVDLPPELPAPSMSRTRKLPAPKQSTLHKM